MKRLATGLVTVLMLTVGGMVMADDVRPDVIQSLQDSGSIQSLETLNNLALEQHPGATIHDTELKKKGERYIYEVELRDQRGAEWDLKFDAGNGTLLKNKKDD